MLSIPTADNPGLGAAGVASDDGNHTGAFFTLYPYRLDRDGNDRGVLLAWAWGASRGVAPAIADGQTALAMPYDNPGGLLSGIALTNSGGAQASVQLAARDETGAVTDNVVIDLAAGAKTEFILTDKAPNSAGKRGLIQLTTQGSSISALGLRPGNDVLVAETTPLRSWLRTEPRALASGCRIAPNLAVIDLALRFDLPALTTLPVSPSDPGAAPARQ